MSELPPHGPLAGTRPGASFRRAVPGRDGLTAPAVRGGWAEQGRGSVDSLVRAKLPKMAMTMCSSKDPLTDRTCTAGSVQGQNRASNECPLSTQPRRQRPNCLSLKALVRRRPTMNESIDGTTGRLSRHADEEPAPGA